MSIITNDLDYIKKESDVLEDGLKDIKNDMIIFEHYMDMTNKLLSDKNISEKLNICYHSLTTQINLLEEKYDKLLIENHNFEKKFKNLKEKINKLNNNYKSLIEKNDKLKEENLKLKNDLEIIYKSPKLLKDEEIFLLFNLYDELEKKNEKLVKENDGLKMSLNIIEKEKENKSKKEKIYITSSEENNKFDINLHNENEENSNILMNELSKENKPPKEQNIQLNSDYNKLKEENKKLRVENEAQKNDLNNINNNQKTNKFNNKNINIFINELYKQKNLNFKQIKERHSIKLNYSFPTKIFGNTCSIPHINSLLQCLLHINELTDYFLNEYPKASLLLKQKNNKLETQGKLSETFYSIINNINENNNNNININNKNYLSSNNINKNYFNPVDLQNFQKVILDYKPQFNNKESIILKELILFIFQTIHEELNYNGSSISEFKPQIDLLDKFSIFNNSNMAYNINNLSIISKLFYGTFEKTMKCNSCKTITYQYSKFEFISFPMNNYENKIFNIYNGFDDIIKPKIIQENCNNCEKQYDAEYSCKIKELPNKLLIVIDYNGVNPTKIEFDEIINVSQYVTSNFGLPIKYELFCVCNYVFDSKNNTNNYVAYCKNKENQKLYNFDDSFTFICHNNDIYLGNPYLFLYEKL